jgi:hypothetical protein
MHRGMRGIASTCIIKGSLFKVRKRLDPWDFKNPEE